MATLGMAVQAVLMVTLSVGLATLACEQETGSARKGGQAQQARAGGMDRAENDARAEPVLQNLLSMTSKTGDFTGQPGGRPAVVLRHRNEVMKLPGVVGIAAGLCRKSSGHCVLVYVIGDQWPPGLPRELEGIPIELVPAGRGFRPR